MMSTGNFHDASDTTERVSAAPSELCKVGIRIPPFWPEEPEIWFMQIEGQFQIAGITNDLTKFHYIVGQLDQQYLREVKDILAKPPTSNRYEKLKTELTKRLSASKEKKVQQLILHEELGDRKPSQFLRHLQSLAGRQVTNDFLRTVWTSRLPGNIQTVLAAQPSAELETLADLADRVHDIVPSAPQVASTSSDYGSKIDAMAREIAELRNQLKNINVRDSSRRHHSRSNRNDHRNPRSRSQSSYRKHPNCWYHSKHGDKALKCIKPCDYEKSGNARGSR